MTRAAGNLPNTMSTTSSLSDDYSIRPNSHSSRAVSPPRGPNQDYRTFASNEADEPSDEPALQPQSLLMHVLGRVRILGPIVVWMIALPLVLGALYVCFDLLR